jgi:hypothetical protein
MTIPKLSDAILLGSTMGPQGYGSFSMTDKDAPCSLGGALLAVGRFTSDPDEAYEIVKELWPWTNQQTFPCPDNCGNHRVGFNLTWHLNDTHGWTRERIAAWVATIEPETPSAGENEAEVGESTPEAQKGLISAR